MISSIITQHKINKKVTTRISCTVVFLYFLQILAISCEFRVLIVFNTISLSEVVKVSTETQYDVVTINISFNIKLERVSAPYYSLASRPKSPRDRRQYR